MNKSTNLDMLIREVNGMDAAHNRGEEVVIRILLNPERHFWDTKKEKFFLISKRSGHDCSGEFEFAIEDHALDLRLDLKLLYRVRFGDEPLKTAAGEIAEALYDPEGPQHKLERLIKEWVSHYVKENGGPHKVMLDFFTTRPGLVAFLQRSARERLHLDLFRVTIEPQAAGVTKQTEELAPLSISTVLMDYESPILLQVDVLTLDVSELPGTKILAYLRGGGRTDLRVAIERKLAESIRGHYKLHDFRGVSISPAVKQFLRSELRGTVEAFGRSIRAFDLRADSPLLKLPNFYQFENLSFSVRLPSHPKPIAVTAVVHLKLYDLGLHAGCGISDLREWTRKAIESITISRLSQHQYLRLAEQWDKEKLLISQELDERSATIGLRATFCELSADPPFDLTHRSFTISIVDQELTTDNSEWKVPVGLEACVEIEDLAVFANKWPTEFEIDKRLRESLISVLRHFGREHSPKDWYLNFDESNDPTVEPLKRLLQKVIEEHIRTQFGGKLLFFTVVRKLVQKLSGLREQTPSLSVSVTRSGFRTSLAYHVVDVDPNMWHRFQAAAPSIDELNKRIIRHIEQTFADYDPVTFRRRTNAANMSLLNDLTSPFGIRSLILQQYGLQVYVDHWIRETTELDTKEDTLRFDAEQHDMARRFDVEQRELTVRSTVDIVTLEQQVKLLTVGNDEEQLDIRLLQDEKQEIREKIILLSPVHDKEEIQIMEDRLTELDRRIRGYRSAALQAVLTKQSNRKDRLLEAYLDQAAESPEAVSDVGSASLRQIPPSKRVD